MKYCQSIALVKILILMKICMFAVENMKIENDVVSAITKFCLGKERENFCSDQHLHMMINFAAAQGKSRPIQDIKELEVERQKEIENQASKQNQKRSRLHKTVTDVTQSNSATTNIKLK